ncbi:hypothetical protein [Rhodopirellula baltica]
MFQNDKTPQAKGTLTFIGTVVESEGKDKPRWLKIVQGITYTSIAVIAFTVIFGVPCVRFDRALTQPKDGEQLSTEHLAITRYIGIGGAIDIRAGEFSEGLPTVVLVPIWRAFGEEPRQEI